MLSKSADPWPGVSYVMPVLNEEQHLRSSVMSVLAQSYDGPQELVLAIAPSTDATERIAEELARQDSRITLVFNIDRDIPIGLNLAVKASRYPIVVRVDAHSELSPHYTRDAVQTLHNTGASNVGGIMRAEGVSLVQRAIANSYNSPIGLGGGTYHAEGAAGPAESAYLGVFTRAAFDAVGGFNPSIRRGEDWEFNLRLRRAGHTVWFDPSLQVVYRPRERFGQLVRQFFATGSWRATLVRMYGRENPWRFFVPGAYVISVFVALLIAASWVAGAISRDAIWPWIFIAPPVAHLALTLWGGVRLGRGPAEATLTTAALIAMHLAWGAGFLVGITFGSARIVDRSRLNR